MELGAVSILLTNAISISNTTWYILNYTLMFFWHALAIYSIGYKLIQTFGN